MDDDNEEIKKASKRLLADHLFDPTNKPQWIGKLVEEGLNQQDAKRAYKIAAHNFHISRNKLRNEKSGLVGRIIEVVGFAGAALLAVIIGQWAYIFLVVLLVALLGFIFGF